MGEGGTEARGRRRGGWLPLFFALLAGVLAVAAVVVTLQERGRSGAPPVPQASPGRNEFIHAVEALRAQGAAVEIGRRGVPRGELSVPGQEVIVDGIPAYVFVFPDPETAASEAAAADPARALPRSGAVSGQTPGATPAAATAAAAGGAYLVQGSNIVLVVSGGDASLRERARAAIEGLP